jgi:hypothetical protein
MFPYYRACGNVYRRKLRIKNYNNALKLFHALRANVHDLWKVKLKAGGHGEIWIVTYKPSSLNIEFDAYTDFILIQQDNLQLKVRSIDDCIDYCKRNTFYAAR